MAAFLLNRKTKKSCMETIMSLAISSRSSYQSVLNRLEEFCYESYEGRTANDIVEELKYLWMIGMMRIMVSFKAT